MVWSLWVTLIGWFRSLWAALIGWFGGLWGGLVLKSQIWWLEVCNVTSWRKNFCQHCSFIFPQNIGKVMNVRHYRKTGEDSSHEMWKSQRCHEYYSVAAENVMKWDSVQPQSSLTTFTSEFRGRGSHQHRDHTTCTTTSLFVLWYMVNLRHVDRLWYGLHTGGLICCSPVVGIWPLCHPFMVP